MPDTSEAQFQNPAVAPLDTIVPDRFQPRRLLPDDLTEGVAAGSLSSLEALQEWLRRVEYNITEAGPRHNVRELKRLADSIAQHGLITPISVRLPQPGEPVPSGTNYVIVTGERRYWAHVYLLSQGQQIQAGQATISPQEIKISLAPSGITIRAHQLIENLLREDLNAVERARGMWALRYELSGVNYSSPSQGQIETTEEMTEEDSLASSIAPDQLVPWVKVEEALSISKRYRIFVVSVLQLNEAAQALIAAHNLAEMTIRPITQKLKNRPELQLKALQQLVAWQTAEEEDEGPGQSIVASVKELVDQLLIDEAAQNSAQADSGPTRRSRSVSSAPVNRLGDKVRQTLDFLNRLKKSDRAELTKALYYGDYSDVMLDLRNLRQQIDTILNSVPDTVEPTMTPPQLTPPDTSSGPSEPENPSPETDN